MIFSLTLAKDNSFSIKFLLFLKNSSGLPEKSIGVSVALWNRAFVIWSSRVSSGVISKLWCLIFEQNRIILEKLEEAYLYIIELEKRISRIENKGY